MAKEQQRLPASPAVAAGWFVLVLGLVWAIFGIGRLLFVVSYGFVAEEVTEQVGYNQACVEQIDAAPGQGIPSGCAMQFTGVIHGSNGVIVTYSSKDKLDAAVEQLRLAQRVRSIVIAAAGLGVTALGLALISAGHHGKRTGRRRATK